MKRLIPLLLLGACASEPLTQSQEDKGTYLFHRKLKEAYGKFLRTEVMDGDKIYAGANLTEFVNGQPLTVKSLYAKAALTSTYQAPDGSQLEYLKHSLQKLTDDSYHIEFGTMVEGGNTTKSVDFFLRLVISCKPKLDCSGNRAEDMVKLEDPYDFTFKFNQQLFTSKPVDYSQFTDAEVTAIKGRYLFRGMNQKAAEYAVGESTGYKHGFHDMKFENNFLKSFEFRYTHDLPLFNSL